MKLHILRGVMCEMKHEITEKVYMFSQEMKILASYDKRGFGYYGNADLRWVETFSNEEKMCVF